jgi:hypothetical protein
MDSVGIVWRGATANIITYWNRQTSRFEHALNGAINELCGSDIIHVIFPHSLEYIAKKSQGSIRLALWTRHRHSHTVSGKCLAPSKARSSATEEERDDRDWQAEH